MQLKNAIENIEGLRYMIDLLNIKSSLARRILFDLPYLSNSEKIKSELEKIELFYNLFTEVKNLKVISLIESNLQQIKDIRGSSSRLKNKYILDDIELFELKVFSLLVVEVRQLLDSLKSTFYIPNLQCVIEILDPDKNNIPHFYIYDSYSNDLAEIRKKIKKLNNNNSDLEVNQLYTEHEQLEDEIRRKISEQLWSHSEDVNKALQAVAELDILFAKAKQAIDLNLTKPLISENQTCYKGIFNPQIQNELNKRNKIFQPVDIKINNSPCLITGVNMGGKTVLLKSIALSQMLFQFGFYVPAKQANISIIDETILLSGDGNSIGGLSSFAAEMERINNLIKKIKVGKKILALIDEPARTTNPHEGVAIVDALMCFLTKYQVKSLVSTHFSGIKCQCEKLRVKGFKKEIKTTPMKIENIQDFMDYSLENDNTDKVPQEALKIAEMLGMDEEFLEMVKK